MKRRTEVVDSAPTGDGEVYVLVQWGDDFEVRIGPHLLMSSCQHGSEESLARLGLARAPAAATVLLGGLGLGYTLRATLDLLGPHAHVVVAELSDALVKWNRTHVAELADRPLDDPRAKLRIGDVLDRVREAPGAYDAILLDVDNGPNALVQSSNDDLYDAAGIRACLAALRPGGVLAVWSAEDDPGYLERLQQAGCEARACEVAASEHGTSRHVIFVAEKPATTLA